MALPTRCYVVFMFPRFLVRVAEEIRGAWGWQGKDGAGFAVLLNWCVVIPRGEEVDTLHRGDLARESRYDGPGLRGVMC